MIISGGKSVNLFLMDGTASGRMKCSLANWTGVAYKIPRNDIELCKHREDLTRSGVYFLYGVSELTGKPVVYIGQAGTRKNGEGILGRLREHKRDLSKDYWSEAIVFTTSNNSFGPTEISYLENRFCYLAVQANRYDVKNSNEPSPGNITEEKESELEEFIECAELIMGVLGHNVFDPYVEQPKIEVTPIVDIEPNDNPTLYLQARTADASGVQTDDGFIVFKGSRISPFAVPNCPDIFYKLREQHSDKIVDDILTEDIRFLSCSAASGFIMFDISDGLTAWLTGAGMTLREVERQKAS